MDSARIESLLAEFRRNLNVAQATGVSQLFGPAHFPSLLGRSLAMMCGSSTELDQAISRYLSGIPSETTLGERRFLYNFFLDYWDGQKDVLEVGPFLGGTTRAIALGMLHHAGRHEAARLRTYDRFGDYYKPEQLSATLAPLFEAGVLGPEVQQLVRQSGRFREVFDCLHAGQDYGPLVEAHIGALPSVPGEPEDPATAFALPEDRAYSAVFVDGAKSWYGTKRFMALASSHTESGAYWLFQDYGAHTCYWVPVFLELFKARFQPVAHIDHTYAFRQVAPLSADEIGRGFPDRPQDLTAADFREIFRNLCLSALESDNTYLLLNYQLQHAAALATLGFKEEARDRIVDLLKTPHALKYRQWILRALSVPTYTPEGNVDLF
jgi:hypothetical protein